MGNPVPLEETQIAGVKIRPAIIGDCFELAPLLREVDREEVAESSGYDALTALLLSFGASEQCYVATKDNVPFFMGGTSAIGDGGATIWGLGSDVLVTMPKTFTKKSRQWVEFLGEGYTYLTNAIMETNEFHLKWVSYMGCELIRRIPNYGVGNKTFIQFVRYPNV